MAGEREMSQPGEGMESQELDPDGEYDNRVGSDSPNNDIDDAITILTSEDPESQSFDGNLRNLLHYLNMCERGIDEGKEFDRGKIDAFKELFEAIQDIIDPQMADQINEAVTRIESKL
ncbi:MAG: hypothetical protein WC693_01970 [Patescibacteria group bacterium]|jgi:hypothetical protein